MRVCNNYYALPSLQLSIFASFYPSLPVSKAKMTSHTQSQSEKITFNMDWTFGGVQLEKILLEKLLEQIQEARNADNGFKKATLVTLASSITLAYHSAGAPVQNKLTWQQIKGKVNSVGHTPQS
jgi:hypothetical protein